MEEIQRQINEKTMNKTSSNENTFNMDSAYKETLFSSNPGSASITSEKNNTNKDKMEIQIIDDENDLEEIEQNDQKGNLQNFEKIQDAKNKNQIDLKYLKENEENDKIEIEIEENEILRKESEDSLSEELVLEDNKGNKENVPEISEFNFNKGKTLHKFFLKLNPIHDYEKYYEYPNQNKNQGNYYNYCLGYNDQYSLNQNSNEENNQMDIDFEGQGQNSNSNFNLNLNHSLQNILPGDSPYFVSLSNANSGELNYNLQGLNKFLEENTNPNSTPNSNKYHPHHTKDVLLAFQNSQGLNNIQQQPQDDIQSRKFNREVELPISENPLAKNINFFNQESELEDQENLNPNLLNQNQQMNQQIQMEQNEENIPKGIKNDINYLSLPNESNSISVEFFEDLYLNLIQEEKSYPKIKSYISKQTDISGRMRAMLIDWISEVFNHFKFKPETFYLTCQIIDRYLERKFIQKCDFQLLGVTAICLASKYNEYSALDYNEYSYIADYAFDAEKIKEMELEVLRVLEWNVSTVPTSFQFYDILSHNFNLSENEYNLGRYFCESFVMDYRSVRYSNSLIACAAIYLVLKIHNFRDYKLVFCFKYQSDMELKDCAKEILDLHLKVDETNLVTVKNKYKMKHFCCVAENLKFQRID